ncbi:MAG: gamma-glutamyl-gamma-aminobutyrate hydrolase family protein [Pseudomonadota bacterium]
MSDPLRVGILETGRPPPHLQGAYDSYPDMMVQMLGPHDRELVFTQYAALDGELPASVEVCDAWLITGSKFAAYDPDPWVAALKGFVRQAFERGRPMLGICFGHQIMAAALGGEVKLADAGWGVGVHRYTLDAAPAWLGETPATLAIQAFHQDQVVTVPPGATVLAHSDFCPVAALGYGTQALSVQAHPEFTADYVSELLRFRRELIGAERVDAALDGIGAPLDSDLIARWFAGVARGR